MINTTINYTIGLIELSCKGMSSIFLQKYYNNFKENREAVEYYKIDKWTFRNESVATDSDDFILSSH